MRNLEEKLPRHCLHAIKSHDYRTGFEPKNKLDNALIIADTMAAIIEGLKKSEKEKSSKENIKKEILKALKNKPWLKDNLKRIEKL